MLQCRSYTSVGGSKDVHPPTHDEPRHHHHPPPKQHHGDHHHSMGARGPHHPAGGHNQPRHRPPFPPPTHTTIHSHPSQHISHTDTAPTTPSIDDPLIDTAFFDEDSVRTEAYFCKSFFIKNGVSLFEVLTLYLSPVDSISSSILSNFNEWWYCCC